MTWGRPFLLSLGAVLALLLVAVGVASSSAFQIWAVRRALLPQAGYLISLETVSVGWSRVAVTGLRVEYDGRTLVVPRLDAELPLLAALGGEFKFARVTAPAFSLQLPPPAATATATVSTAAAEAAVQAFSGLLARCVVPSGFTLDGLDCAGTVALPGSRAVVELRVMGGGMRPGGEGRFGVTAKSQPRTADVDTVAVNGDLVLSVGNDRRVAWGTARLAATARGRRFPEGFALQGDFSVRGEPGREAYAATVVTAGREVLSVAAEFKPETQSFSGSWKVDLRDHDLAPFVVVRPLPEFSAAGQGTFATTLPPAAVRVAGKLRGSVDHLEFWVPGLPPLGPLQIDGDFDLAEQNGVIGVQKCEAVLAARRPVATVRSLQAFEFNPRSRELRAADPTRDLLGIVFHEVPLSWANRWLGEFALSGDGLRGEMVASPRGGGVSVRSVAPLSSPRLNLAKSGHLLVDGLSVTTNLTADYSPQGWQAEFKGFSALRGDATVVSLEAKVGGLAGQGQTVKTAGRAVLNVPALLAQPWLAAKSVVTAGDAQVEFAASFSHATELQANVTLKNLALVGPGPIAELPVVTLKLRADLDAQGKVELDLPVILECRGVASDVRIAGSVVAGPEGTQRLDLQCVGAHVEAEHFAALAAAWPLTRETRVATAVWSDWRGTIQFQFETCQTPNGLILHQAGGLILVDATTVRLAEGAAGLVDGAHAVATGELGFQPQAAKPYGLSADFTLREFDLGPIWRASGRTAPAVLDGRFDVAGRLSARSVGWAGLAEAVGGELELTSKGGVFRGLRVSAANPAEPSKGLAGLFASAGSMLAGGLSGKKEQADIASRSEAVAELARSWSAIVYDQLSVRVSSDAAFNTVLRDFSLIAPELRLTGYGTALHQPGRGWLEDALAMKFRLRARGRQADLLKYLGALESQTDDLGYNDGVFPLAVGGTLGRPDATELNRRLAALALEKPGLTDKAAELLNKLWGGKASP